MKTTSELICIRCPIGCRLSVVTQEDGSLSVSGNTCPKGAAYAKEELTSPTRIITCLVRVAGSDQPLSVKTAGGVPKSAIFDCIEAIKALSLTAPVSIGSVVLKDVCGTGIDVVATKSV